MERKEGGRGGEIPIESTGYDGDCRPVRLPAVPCTSSRSWAA